MDWIEQRKGSLRQEVRALDSSLADVERERRQLLPPGASEAEEEVEVEPQQGAESETKGPPRLEVADDASAAFSDQEQALDMSAGSVLLRLTTLTGVEHNLPMRSSALVGEAKRAAAAALGQPAELQRWVVGAATLADGVRLRSLSPGSSTSSSPAGSSSASSSPQGEEAGAGAGMPELQVQCVFVPRTFNVNVKVIRFTPPQPSQTDPDVLLPVSPCMTIDAVKMELASRCGVQAGTFMRLLKGGIKLEDQRIVEAYRVSEGDTLHVVMARP